MYLYDLTTDKRLKAIITHFINNLHKPSNLTDIAEPTFIKKLLSLKRELLMQGVEFSSLKNQKKTKKKM